MALVVTKRDLTFNMLIDMLEIEVIDNKFLTPNASQ